MHHLLNRLAAAVFILPLAAIAQGSEPPAGSSPITGESLRAAVNGKVFTYAANASGLTGRAQYQDGGFVYINLSNGAKDSGKWRVEDDKLCYEFQRFPAGCVPVRSKGAALFVRRSSDSTWAELKPE